VGMRDKGENCPGYFVQELAANQTVAAVHN
jgi:hypothetical protein